ncbi:enoyl-CoA hydratase/isomerase family protein [Lipingzhangella sp. LS1_29]|uniref:Enoyl-CoA hydratase/isomerase family protein n=1 Tax=Lipingzhangella rawalii TaxID=2055835 RepID=A0ABU2H9A7_9ACTN|nr:enoyl-CoA hydratase/isomerase family protein [Lipingzhangella rawalii]MDS1271592.1 enoyl-CoA hydratase/isomerase family protein [Lipingzhangella rawalii]
MSTKLPTEQELTQARLRLEIDGAVATVVLDRLDRRNAMTARTWHTLARIGDALPDDVRVVVFRGEGDTFSAGIDLAMFDPEGPDGEPSLLAQAQQAAQSDSGRAELEEIIAGVQRGFTWLRRPEVVTIAAVRGHAIGAGFQLALSCDIRILAEDAQLCMKEPALGLVPDLTGTKPLVDLVGVHRAMELCLTARTVDAGEARELRLAELVVPAAELSDTVADLTGALLTVPAGAASATKRVLQRAADASGLEEAAAAERTAQVERLFALLSGE